MSLLSEELADALYPVFFATLDDPKEGTIQREKMFVDRTPLDIMQALTQSLSEMNSDANEAFSSDPKRLIAPLRYLCDGVEPVSVEVSEENSVGFEDDLG